MDELKQKLEYLLSEKKVMVKTMEQRLFKLEDEFEGTPPDKRTEGRRNHIQLFRDILIERKRVVKELEELLEN
jgi:predicted RNase H-like nuclease (RuvC/YqgF family)